MKIKIDGVEREVKEGEEISNKSVDSDAGIMEQLRITSILSLNNTV